VAVINKEDVVREAGAVANRKNKRAVRAIVIPFESRVEEMKKGIEDQTGYSKKLPEDPFESLIKEGLLLQPPFDLLTLAMLPEHSSEMNQCIDSMVANIDGFGYRFVPRVRMDKVDGDIDKKLLQAVKKEQVDLQNFFAYACLRDSFTGFRKKLRKDIETTGNGWFEVIRSMTGEIQGFSHMPAYQMRMGAMEKDPIQVKMPVLELQADGSVEVKKINVWQRFRMHTQAKTTVFRNVTLTSEYTLRFFKEFGDPRVYDNTTGKVVEGKKLEDFPEGKRANEVVHMRLYSPRSPYGLPRYIGNLLGIFGDRAAEEINYITFRNNNIPSMALVVSNGQLTEATVRRLESFVESQIQGSDNYSKFLIIEGESAEVEGEEPGQVKIDIKPLTKEQHQDELFQNYSRNNQDKVRRAFRLPPIFVGRSDDYTRATAESSRRLADEQVFAPERDDFDDYFNRIMFPAMGIRYHRFKSNSPNTTDNQELVKILAGAEKTGGMTPRIARTMLEDILGVELPGFPDDFPADEPFSMTMAEKVKNNADPTEPGQQVTALKAIEDLTKSDIPLFGMSDDDLVDRLMTINSRIETEWREKAAWTEDDE